MGESWSWGTKNNVAESQLENWPLLLPSFVTVLNQKEEHLFVFSLLVSQLCDVEENQQGGSEDFERLELWICACWGNAVGRGQCPSVTLLLSTALWCCHVQKGYQFSLSPWQVIFNPNVTLLTYVNWPKGCNFLWVGSPVLLQCLEKKA